MNLFKPKTWFAKTEGVYVDVDLDGCFGAATLGKGLSPYEVTLHISDLPLEKSKVSLDGSAFDWHRIPYEWRHNMEIKRLHKATWVDVKKYLRTLN